MPTTRRWSHVTRSHTLFGLPSPGVAAQRGKWQQEQANAALARDAREKSKASPFRITNWCKAASEHVPLQQFGRKVAQRSRSADTAETFLVLLLFSAAPEAVTSGVCGDLANRILFRGASPSVADPLANRSSALNNYWVTMHFFVMLEFDDTTAIAGREWLENIAEKLKHHHLQPIREDTYQSFTGLGGAKRESHRKWILPIGISGKHTTQAYYEIPGSMIGLTSREDLERWGCNLYLRSHEVHADFETLNIYGKSLLRLPIGHAVLDIMDYDEKHVLDDPIFQPFVTGKKGFSALLAFEAVIPKDTFLSDRLARNNDEETTWVQEAIRSGTKGTYSKKVTTELDRLARTYRTMFDVIRDDGSTFMWELSSHGSQLTKVSTYGGHRAGTPSLFQKVIKTGQLRHDLVKLTSHLKPWPVGIFTEDEASSHENFCVSVLREQARSDCLAMVSWSGQLLVEMTNHDQVVYVTSNSLLLQALQKEQETYEKMSSWKSNKVIKHFSTSIITGATADALASDENISWGLCSNVSEDELTKTVAHALLLRPECLAVRIRRKGDVMTTCPTTLEGSSLITWTFRLRCGFHIYTTGYT